MAEQAGLNLTWSKISETRFRVMWLSVGTSSFTVVDASLTMKTSNTEEGFRFQEYKCLFCVRQDTRIKKL